jgi:hypothetical protein
MKNNLCSIRHGLLLLASLLLPWSGGSAEILRPGERVLPGAQPDDALCFDAPATSRNVVIRHSGTWWLEDHALAFSNGAGCISTRDLQWKPGHYEFKFVIDGTWEEGPNRYAYVGADGLLRRPPALYLTWQHDPTTTMTVHWHGDDPAETARVNYRTAGSNAWQVATGSSTGLPGTGRIIHTVELTGLTPGGDVEFRIGPGGAVHRFRTLPAHLDQPLRFIEGGDVYEIGGAMDAMNRMVAARDPAFVVIGGDLAYANGSADLVQRWYPYLASFTENMVAPDGRVIPVVVAIGNHEMQNHYLQNHPDYTPSPAWREKVAPQFYRLFAFPGHPGYGVLDVGDYLSLVILDSHITNPVDGEQWTWLKRTLAERRRVPHLFPIYHIPAYPSVRSLHDPISTLIRTLWVPLFEQAGVHLAFEHHDHAFKITQPMRGGKVDPDGIVFVGDGAWSVGLRLPNTQPEQATYLRKAQPVHHVFEITLTPSNRTVRALDMTGNDLDVFEQAVQ